MGNGRERSVSGAISPLGRIPSSTESVNLPVVGVSGAGTPIQGIVAGAWLVWMSSGNNETCQYLTPSPRPPMTWLLHSMGFTKPTRCSSIVESVPWEIGRRDDSDMHHAAVVPWNS